MSNDTSANAYTTLSDGYIVAKTNAGSGHGIVRLSKDTTNPYFDAPQFSGIMLSYTCYVPKGCSIYVDSSYKSAFNECVFCPLIEY